MRIFITFVLFLFSSQMAVASTILSASFSGLVTERSIPAVAYDENSEQIRGFNASLLTAEELGLTGFWAAFDPGSRVNGRFEVQRTDYGLDISCLFEGAGDINLCVPGSALAFNTVSVTRNFFGGAISEFVARTFNYSWGTETVLRPDGGSFYYEDDGYYSGTLANGGIWFGSGALGLRLNMTLDRVSFDYDESTATVVPLPASSWLLLFAVGMLSLRRPKRRPC